MICSEGIACCDKSLPSFRIEIDHTEFDQRRGLQLLAEHHAHVHSLIQETVVICEVNMGN